MKGKRWTEGRGVEQSIGRGYRVEHKKWVHWHSGNAQGQFYWPFSRQDFQVIHECTILACNPTKKLQWLIFTWPTIPWEASNLVDFCWSAQSSSTVNNDPAIRTSLDTLIFTKPFLKFLPTSHTWQRASPLPDLETSDDSLTFSIHHGYHKASDRRPFR